MKRQHPTDPNLFWCPKCKTYKTREEFRKRSSGGLSGYCVVCKQTADRDYQHGHTRENSLRCSRWRSDNAARERASHLKNERLTRARIGDLYVKQIIRQTLGMAARDVSEEMITLKRQQIIMIRTLKQFKQWRKEQENEPNHTDVYGKQFTDEENHEGRISA